MSLSRRLPQRNSGTGPTLRGRWGQHQQCLLLRHLQCWCVRLKISRELVGLIAHPPRRFLYGLQQQGCRHKPLQISSLEVGLFLVIQISCCGYSQPVTDVYAACWQLVLCVECTITSCCHPSLQFTATPVCLHHQACIAHICLC